MKSMTGYGTAEGRVGKGILYVEIKSINHRFSEYNIKIPPKMGVIETRIRSFLQTRFQRGKVDVYFKEKAPLLGGVSISIDTELAKKYHKAIQKISRELKINCDDDFLEIVGLDRLVRVEEQDGSYDRLWSGINQLVLKAARHVEGMQLKEGSYIKKDQVKRIAILKKLIKKIANESSRALGNHLDRVRKKVANSNGNGDVDEQRLLQEVALIGGRQDIAEELIRLDSHTKQYEGLINLREPVGRKMDFLLQEMNREANTIGSKAGDATISQLVVSCKTELERLKEQIQNIE